MALKHLRSGRQKSETYFTEDRRGKVEAEAAGYEQVCVCLRSTELGTKCLALQVCVPVVVEACEARCGGGYVTAVMIGCGG